MAGTGQEDGVEVVLVDQAIEVNVGEAQAGTGAPVTQQPLLDVLRLQRLAQQRIGAQIDHAGGQVVAGPPVGVDLAKFFTGQPV